MSVPQTTHASAIVLGHLGVLIRGASGAGKSRLAHGLVEQFQRDGNFARWVSDDRTILQSSAGKIIARSPDTIAGIAERRFAGVTHVDHQSSCVVDFVVDLIASENLERMPVRETFQITSDSSSISVIQVPKRDVPLAIELVFDHVTKLLTETR